MLLGHMFRDLPKLLIGRGIVSKLSEEVNRLASRSVLLIAEPNLSESNLLQLLRVKLMNQVKKLDIHFITNVKEKLSNQSHAPQIEALAADNYDTVIGLGSNDLLNYTKIMSLYMNDLTPLRTESEVKIENRVHTILLPLTPTIGLELRNHTYQYEDELRTIIPHPGAAPQLVIYDPTLSTKDSPYELIATSAMTLAKALDIYFFIHEHKEFPLATIKLIMTYLVRAVYSENDLQAIEALYKASMLLGVVPYEDQRISLYDSFVIPIKSKVRVAYPIALATVLPHMIELYMQVNEQRGRHLLQTLGLASLAKTELDKFFAKRLANIMQTVGFPLHLRSLGIEETHLEELAFAAYTLWCQNDRPGLNWEEADFFRIYKGAYSKDNEHPF